MKHFTHTSISLLLLLITMATLLGCGADKNLKKGEKYLAIGEYYDAATQFKQAYTKTSTKEKAKRGDIALKIAYCNERINSTQKAQAAYANAIRYGRATAADRLSYARQLLRNGSYKQAGEQFAIVLDSINAGAYPTPTKKGNTNTLDANAAKTLAQNGLIAAQKAPEWKKQGSRYKVKRMDVFNSRRDDYSKKTIGENGANPKPLVVDLIPPMTKEPVASLLTERKCILPSAPAILRIHVMHKLLHQPVLTRHGESLQSLRLQEIHCRVMHILPCRQMECGYTLLAICLAVWAVWTYGELA